MTRGLTLDHSLPPSAGPCKLFWGEVMMSAWCPPMPRPQDQATGKRTDLNKTLKALQKAAVGEDRKELSKSIAAAESQLKDTPKLLGVCKSAAAK
eukprot:9380396-Pyramimonas_sp.AAC.1